ncbi:MAG: hypothetical protein U9N45_00535 [Gemmatimonadota bacterium]|nr:hypothetical protein [Gemmatimonadota bacterium]
MKQPQAAEPVKKIHKEWSTDDLMACILSPLAYLNITAGVALLLLNHWAGYVMTINGVAFSVALFYIINPKLSAVSAKFEKKQKEYLEELDKIIGWEEDKPD